jgi:dihydroorotase
MPNTQPAVDNAALVEATLIEAAAVSPVRVLTTGCITKERAGRELAPMAELVEAGAVALTDDGDFVADAGVMRRAFEYASMWSLPLAQHCEDPVLAAGGHMHEGWVSARLGLPGRPASAEVAAVARDIALAEELGAHLHVQHLSTARGVELVVEARGRGVHVTAEVTPHHLTLTHEAVAFGLSKHSETGEDSELRYDTNAKVNPPLREPADVAACVEGLRSGAIDCIATDHAPHASHEKQAEFDQAPPGLIGLETALALSLRLVHEGRMDVPTLIERLSAGPVRAWGLDQRTGIDGLGSLRIGAPGDIAIFDPDAEWIVDEASIASKSHNTPLLGETLRGRVLTTIAAGQVVYEATPVRG